MASECFGEITGWAADATAHVEYPFAAVEFEKSRKFDCCDPAARMELIYRCEIIWREMVDVFSCRFERVKNHINEPRPSIVFGDCAWVRHSCLPTRIRILPGFRTLH